MDEKSNKVKLLVYATEDDRARINASKWRQQAAHEHEPADLGQRFEQVASIDELEKNGGARE